VDERLRNGDDRAVEVDDRAAVADLRQRQALQEVGLVAAGAKRAAVEVERGIAAA
jgi:hypothetical protein